MPWLTFCCVGVQEKAQKGSNKSDTSVTKEEQDEEEDEDDDDAESDNDDDKEGEDHEDQTIEDDNGGSDDDDEDEFNSGDEEVLKKAGDTKGLHHYWKVQLVMFKELNKIACVIRLAVTPELIIFHCL